MGLRAKGLGLRVQGLGLRVWGFTGRCRLGSMTSVWPMRHMTICFPVLIMPPAGGSSHTWLRV